MTTTNKVMYGVDLSHWNSWSNSLLARTIGGVEFAMLKIGGSDKRNYYIDKKFLEHYHTAKMRGIKVGVYFFAGAAFRGTLEGQRCARYVLEQLKKFNIELDMPIAIDVERGSSKYRNQQTLATVAFCEEIEKAKHYAVIYGADVATFKTLLNMSALEKYDKWVARYGKKPEYVKKYGMWQWTSKGKVKGFSGNIDCNIAFKNYPEIIKNLRK